MKRNVGKGNLLRKNNIIKSINKCKRYGAQLEGSSPTESAKCPTTPTGRGMRLKIVSVSVRIRGGVPNLGPIV